MRMARAAAVVVTIVCVVLSGCISSASDRSTPTPSGTISWAACDDGLSCASLTVPLDHDDPDGESIDLELAVRPARDSERRIGVLLTNPGGPGASGIESLRSGLPIDHKVLERFDVISWDPRGLGDRNAIDRNAIDCGASLDRLLTLDPRPESDERPEVDRLAAAVPSACGAGAGGVVDHLATQDHAGDIESIRRATGETSISYLGFSYGTRLGLEYLALHGERVRAMVLDSVVDPALDLDELLAAQAIDIERASIDTPALAERFEAVRDQTLDDQALTAVRADRAAVLAAYDPAMDDAFQEAIAEAEGGNAAALDAQGRRYERFVDFAAYLATTCADAEIRGGEQAWDALEVAIERNAPTLGSFVINEVRPCAYWPVVDQPQRTDLTSIDNGSVVLLLANTGDPVTPVDWARAVSAELLGSTLVEIAAQGHIALDGSACASTLAGEVLLDGAVADGADCR